MKKRFTEEQIIRVLKEHEGGKRAVDIIREHGISEQTFYRWKSKFGGMCVIRLIRTRIPALSGRGFRLYPDADSGFIRTGTMPHEFKLLYQCLINNASVFRSA